MKLRKAKHRWESRPWTISAWVRSPPGTEWRKVSNIVWSMGLPKLFISFGSPPMANISLTPGVKG